MGANSDSPHMRRTSVAVNLQIDWRELKPNIACSFYEPYAIFAVPAAALSNCSFLAQSQHDETEPK